MKKWRKVGVLIFSFLIFFPIGRAKNFEKGVYIRLRHEYWKNIFDLRNENIDSGDRNYFRTKLCGWMKFSFKNLNFSKETALFLRLTDEFKAFTYFGGSSDKKMHFDINEVVVDNLYLDMKDLLGFPLDVRIGRQDFLFDYGEGFLIMDGNPLDGSRTFYFNSAKFSWKLNEKDALDFVYILNHRDDDFLPIINKNSPPTSLNYTDEQAFVTYLKKEISKNFYLESYYIFKHEDKGGKGLQTEETKLNTLGGFIKYNFPSFILRGQLAYQFGDYGDNDREGLGGYLFINKNFEEEILSPQLSVGFIYLSGDDRSTSKCEAWDPLFSRWPWMSELYILTYSKESGVGYWTNLLMWRTKVGLIPFSKARLNFWVNYLKAENSQGGLSAMFGDEKNRGILYQLRMDYKITDNIKAYVLTEYFIPGDFYSPGYRDEALFTRAELSFRF